MEFQRYKVEDKDLALLNKLYIYLNYKPSFYGNVELNVTIDYAVRKIEEIIGESYSKLNSNELKVLRNTCFSDNQIKFMDIAENAGYDVQFQSNDYGTFDPYIVSTNVDVRINDFLYCEPGTANYGDVFYLKTRVPYPMRGMHNGRWVDYFYFIAVQ